MWFSSSLTLGANLRAARQRAKLSQADLAERAGVSRRTVVSIEQGRSAELSTILSVMRALGLEMGLREAPPASFGLATLDTETEDL